MLIPPNWIRSIMIQWPLCVKQIAVSITVSPVTQTALVEVNKESINEIPLIPGAGSLVISGNIKRRVPKVIRPIKEITSN